MKYIVYRFATAKTVNLNTKEAFVGSTIPEPALDEFETNSLTEAIDKKDELVKLNPDHTGHILLDKNEDWDSVEMDEARKLAQQDKESKENKDTRK